MYANSVKKILKVLRFHRAWHPLLQGLLHFHINAGFLEARDVQKGFNFALSHNGQHRGHLHLLPPRSLVCHPETTAGTILLIHGKKHEIRIMHTYIRIRR